MGCTQSKPAEKQGTISVKSNAPETSNNTTANKNTATASSSSTRPTSTREEKVPASTPTSLARPQSIKDDKTSPRSITTSNTTAPSTKLSSHSQDNLPSDTNLTKESTSGSSHAHHASTPSNASSAGAEATSSHHQRNPSTSSKPTSPASGIPPLGKQSPRDVPLFIYKHVSIGLLMFCRDSFHSKFTGDLMHRWREVEVIDIQGSDRSKVFVHFIGWASTFDHWVDLNEEIAKVSPVGLLTKDELDRGVGLEPVQMLISKEFFISGKLLDPKVAYQRESKRLSRSNANSKSQPIESAVVAEDSLTAAKVLAKGSQSDRNLNSRSNDSEDNEANKFFVANLDVGQKVDCLDIYYKKGANRPSYKWREAQVISKEGPLIRVNYLGWDSKFDENIDAIKDSKRLAKHQSKTLEVVSQTASTLEQNPVIPFVPPPPKDGTSTTTSSSNANATNNHVRKRTFDGELSRLLRLNFTGSGDNSVPGAEPSPSTKSNNSDEDEKSKTFKSRFNLRILRKWMSTRKNESLPNSPMSEGRSSNGSGDEEEIFEEVNDPNMKTPEELEAEIRKEKLFIETLKDKGLQVIEIEGDGNCLFRSISHQLFGVEDYHEDLRAQCVEHMIFHKNRFSMFCFEDFDEHMKEMAKVGIWGDDLEIRALEEIIDRNIRIYSSDSKEMGTPINNNFEEEDLLKGSPPITLSYHGSNHYNSVYDELHPLPLPARSSRTLLQSRIKLFENQPASPPRKPKSNASSNHSTPGQDYEQKTRMHAAAAHHLLQGQLQPQHPPGPMHISHSSGHFQPPMSSTMQMQQSHLNQYNGGIAAGINPPGHNVHYHLPVSPPHHIPNHHGAPHANIAAAHHHAVPNHQHPVGPGHHRVPSNSVPNYHDYHPEYIPPNNMQKVPMLPLLNIDHGAYYSPTNAMKPITPRGVESARSNYPPISNEQAPNRHRRNYSEGNYLHVANEAMGYANMPAPHGNMQHHNSNDNIYDNRMPMVDNNVYSGRRLS